MKKEDPWLIVVASAQKEFEEKAKKYGNSLTAYDTFGILTKVFIKLFRIHTIQKTGVNKVSEDPVETEFPAIINYCIYGFATTLQTEGEKTDILLLCQQAKTSIHKTFMAKNHDYGEIWRDLSISFMVQECIVKFNRMRTIYAESKFTGDKTKLQKDFQEVLTDICNYSIFCKINIENGMNPLI